MSEETPAKEPRRRRVARATQPLPVHATVYLKGRQAPLSIDCFSADKAAGGWAFVKPSDLPGMIRNVFIPDENVSYVEIDRWTAQPSYARQEPAYAPPAPPPGPKVHIPRAPQQTLQSVEQVQRPLRSKMVDGMPFSEAVDENGNLGIMPAGFMPV